MLDVDQVRPDLGEEARKTGFDLPVQERVKELERALGQKQMMIDIKDKMIEIAEETYDIDIKKKLASKASSGSTTTKGSTGTK